MSVRTLALCVVGAAADSATTSTFMLYALCSVCGAVQVVHVCACVRLRARVA